MLFAKINIYRALKTIFSKILISLTLTFAVGELFAQDTGVRMVASGRNAERIISEQKLQDQVEYLTDTLFGGRATGTRGASEAAFWIARRFDSAGLMRIGGSRSQSFKAGNLTGHNIIGFMPGKRSGLKEMYTIVTAHYDSFGIIDGKFFPGADSNASGVVALTSLADMFARMKELDRIYGRNIIFVAMDAREKNSAGAEAFWSALKEGRFKDPVNGETITPAKVHTVVVLDILGGTSAPVHRGRKDYLIMLSDGQYSYDLRRANEGKGLGLDLGFDYYGSKGFTEMFHSKVGDQRVFSRNGAMCVVFTSGITMRTNKTDDVAWTINYEIFKKRIFLIFHWMTKIL